MLLVFPQYNKTQAKDKARPGPGLINAISLSETAQETCLFFLEDRKRSLRLHRCPELETR